MKYAGVAALVGAAGFYWHTLTANLARAEHAFAMSEQAKSIITEEYIKIAQLNEQNAAALNRMQHEHAASIDALQREAAEAKRRALDLSTILERMRHATNTEDGPAAPIVGIAFDGIRGMLRAAGTGNQNGDRNASHKAEYTVRTFELP